MYESVMPTLEHIFCCTHTPTIKYFATVTYLLHTYVCFLHLQKKISRLKIYISEMINEMIIGDLGAVFCCVWCFSNFKTV